VCISERVHPRRAWPDSGRKWETYWYQGTWHPGRKCGIASMQLCEVGLLTSAKGTATRHFDVPPNSVLHFLKVLEGGAEIVRMMLKAINVTKQQML
jgi:hypothetical protein